MHMKISLVKAIETFNFMNNSRLTPDHEVFRVLLTALCKYGSVEEETVDAIKSMIIPLCEAGKLAMARIHNDRGEC